ncbi:MAG: hypothetical protein WCG06_00860, partial [Candidatus Omnitrophota bacterium]
QIFADNSEILYQTLSYNPVTGAVEQRQTYDVQGRVVQISDYDQEGLESRQRNYDALGRQTSDQRFLYATVAAVSWKQIDDYDEIGNLVQTSSFQNGRKAYDETFNPATGLSRFKRWYYQTTTAEQLWRVILCDGQGKASQLTEYDRSGALVHSQIDVSYLDTTVQTQAGMAALQDASPSGLLPDNPDDNSFVYHEGNRQDWAKIYAYTQASTYEQAVIGIDFLKSGQNQRAKTLLDFFYAELHKETDAGQAFTGFYTLYNIDPVNWWKKYEWRKTLGETAWVALFALHYAEAVADPVEKSRALELATAVGKWAALVPHLGGAVAMGMPDSQYGWVISVENNLDYYVICRELAQRAASAQDRALFATEAANNKNWLKASAYDPVRGLFRGGGIADYGSGTVVWRNENPLDSNSWAIGAIGPQVLQDEFGINLDEFVGKIGASFAVSDNGTFGGSLGEAKGFDFGDGANAATLNRRGLKWFEGTQQMILAYKILARFHRATTPGKATYYENLARLFSMRNSDNALAVGAQIFYPYADVEGAQIFGYTNLWKTPYGWRDPNSNAWADLSELGISPFFID